jgi:phosphate transport system permease protein
LREWGVGALAWGSGLGLVALSVALIGDLLRRGLPELSLSYLIEPPARSGLAGGVGPILVGTLLITGVAIATSLPVGVGAAILLREYTAPGSRAASAARRSLDVLAGVPSIVFGLFGLKLFCEMLGLGWSILSGGLTLACMALPLLVRATDEGLSAVPREYRLGCSALGVSRTASLWQVLLPAAMPSILAGLALGLGRALAETAVVMFTAGASTRWPQSILEPSRSLAYHIYILASEVPGGQRRAWTAALVLLVLIAMASGLAQLGFSRWARRRTGGAY